jgi:hypothetical protein
MELALQWLAINSVLPFINNIQHTYLTIIILDSNIFAFSAKYFHSNWNIKFIIAIYIEPDIASLKKES